MPQDDHVVINANIALSGPTLQRIVRTAKTLAGPDERGRFRVDTADLVSDLISRFLRDRGFDAYAADRRHYEDFLPNGERRGGE